MMAISKLGPIAVAFVVLLGAAAARAGSCDPVYSAGVKQANAPYRADVSTTNIVPPPGTPPGMTPRPATGMIYTGSVLYLEIGGNWLSRPLDAKTLITQILAKKRQDKTVCKKLADDSVNGEAAAVYATHDDTPDGTIDTTLWISKKSGLPLKTNMRLAIHPTGGQTTAMLFHYGSVKAPAGAQPMPGAQPAQ